MNNSIMKLELNDLEHRIKVFVDYFIKSISSDPDRNFLSLQSRYQSLEDPEEKLYFVLLTTHFDSSRLADEFYHRLSWNKIQQIDEEAIRQVCQEYIQKKKFTGEYLIGDHKRYFRCLPKDKKIEYSVEILTSYKQSMERYGSQQNYFEIDNKNADFDVLYERMKKIAKFHTRLPRFDHLERLSRLHNFYVTPSGFYAEDSKGPLYGLTCLLFGKRLGKDVGINKQDLVRELPRIWNDQIGGNYTIPNKPNFKQVIASLERWVLDRVRSWESLPSVRRDDKAFVFDIESCLCNWQKGKCIDGS